MSKTLLLISGKPEDREFATQVAIAAGLTMRQTTDFKEACKVIDQEGPIAVLVDAQNEKAFEPFETSIQDTLGLFSDKLDNNHFHFLVDDTAGQHEYLFKSPLFGNLILRKFLHEEGGAIASATAYGKLIKATTSSRHFNPEAFLKTPHDLQKVALKVSSQKQSAVEAVRAYLVKAKFQGRMASIIANSVDELIMNAIFDAPVDAVGKPLYAKTSRDQEIKLTDRSEIEMTIGFDGEYFLVCVADKWGSLDKAKLLSHLSKVYVDERYQVKTTSAGAGLGLATVFNTGGSFVFSCESNSKTQVTVLYRKTENFKNFREQFRFLMTQFYF